MTPRIFSDQPLTANSTMGLTGNAATHVGKVLRLREGAHIVAFDGSGREFDARIESISRDGVSILVGESRDPRTESPIDVTLLQGICRNQRMDWLIQKSTELGVASILPVSCERSVVRLTGSRAERRLEHWRQVAVSACEQSGRVIVPAIAAPASLDEAMSSSAEGQADARLLLDPAAEPIAANALDGVRTVSLLIGPEGGLTDTERRTAEAAGFRPVRIGPRILRTETAPLVALSIIQYLAGDLG